MTWQPHGKARVLEVGAHTDLASVTLHDLANDGETKADAAVAVSCFTSRSNDGSSGSFSNWRELADVHLASGSTDTIRRQLVPS
jgi:hypothetical protein